MAFSAGAASLEHIAQEAGDISGVAHADAEALLGSVQGLEDGGSVRSQCQVSDGGRRLSVCTLENGGSIRSGT